MNLAAYCECGLRRRCQATQGNYVEAHRDRRDADSGGLPHAVAFRARKPIFAAKEIEHCARDSMLRVRLKLQAAHVVETVDSLNRSNGTRAGQIVESDAGRHTALESFREAADEIETLKYCGFSGCALTGSSCAS